MQNSEFGTMLAVVLAEVWAILGGFYYVHPFLPLVFLIIFWGFTVGLNLGIGGNRWWVLLQCTILPVALGFAGYKLGGWQGSMIGLLQFANMFYLAFMVAVVTALTSWKAKSALIAML